MLTGKGMWLWEIENTEADPAAMVQLAQAANLKHVVVKLSDGEYDYPFPPKDPDGQKERLTHDVILAFRKAGITVWGWGFAYGDGVSMEMQAHRLAARLLKYDLTGVVINAEDFGRRRWSSPGGEDRVKRYMETLSGDLASIEGGVLMAFSSYRYLSSHPEFPFAAFMDYCDIAMPQVYWVARGAGDALRNLQDSYQEYSAAFPSKLYIPTGAAFGEYYGEGTDRYYWSATPEQIMAFLNQARAMDLPAVNFWSWQHARNDAANLWFHKTQLWDVIAAYPYDAVVTPGTGESDEVQEIQIEQQGHHDGVYAEMPNNSFNVFVRGGRKMKYAMTSASRSGVWSAWLPRLLAGGEYEILVYVPGVHATTQHAKYYLHGVVGQPSAIIVELNQQRFYDTWVSLGIYQLDANHPQSGMVNLNNLTGEFNKEVAFAGVRWRRVDMAGGTEPGPGTGDDFVADGFDSPVGTRDERRSSQLWPGHWFDATGFGTRYRDSAGNAAYHTGVDLNLNQPHWNVDAGMPVYAVADGEVTFAGEMNIWNGIVIIRHDPLVLGGPYVYSRSAHVSGILVQEGQRVRRGDQIASISRPAGGTEHLHFDISPTEALLNAPGDWPRLNWSRLQRDYVDPKTFIAQNRPR